MASRCRRRWAGVRWAGVRWAGVRWAGVRWAGVRWAGVRWAGVRWAGVPVGRGSVGRGSVGRGSVGRASTGRVSSDTGRAVPDGCRAGTGSGERPVVIGPPRDEYVPDKCPSGSPGNPPAKFCASPQFRDGKRGLSHILSDGTVGARRRGQGVTARCGACSSHPARGVAPRAGPAHPAQQVRQHHDLCDSAVGV